MPRVSEVNSAPTAPFAARTNVGPMALIAAPSQSTSSRRRKRHRYRSSSSSSDNDDCTLKHPICCQHWTCSWESKDRPRSNLNITILEFRDLPVNVSTQHGNERQSGRSRSKSPSIPNKVTFKVTDSPN